MANLKRADDEVLATETARVREILSSPHNRTNVYDGESLKAQMAYIGLEYTDDEITAILAGLRTSGFLVETTDEPTPPRTRNSRTR